MDTAISAALVQAGGLIIAAIILAVAYSTSVRQAANGQTPRHQAPQGDPVPPPRQPTGPVRSLNGDVATPILFRNYSGRPVRLFWMDYEGKPVLVTTIQPGGSARQNTFVTHPFLVTDEAGLPLLLHYPDPQATTISIGV